jgi:hypothetical protein
MAKVDPRYLDPKSRVQEVQRGARVDGHAQHVNHYALLDFLVVRVLPPWAWRVVGVVAMGLLTALVIYLLD